jgi:hypothetical protein
MGVAVGHQECIYLGLPTLSGITCAVFPPHCAVDRKPQAAATYSMKSVFHFQSITPFTRTEKAPGRFACGFLIVLLCRAVLLLTTPY